MSFTHSVTADPEVDQEATALIDALVRTSFVTTAIISKIAADHDLSLTQLRVLAILEDRRVKMTDLADYLGLDKSTISGLIDRAQKRGLVERAPNPLDGRGVDAFLTKTGADLAQVGRVVIASALSPMTGVLHRAESERLTTLLERMLDGR